MNETDMDCLMTNLTVAQEALCRANDILEAEQARMEAENVTKNLLCCGMCQDAIPISINSDEVICSRDGLKHNEKSPACKDMQDLMTSAPNVRGCSGGIDEEN